MQPDEGIQAEIESEDTEVERFSASKSSRDRRIMLQSKGSHSSASDLPEPESSYFDVDEIESKPGRNYRRLSTAIESTTVWPNNQENQSYNEPSYEG